VKSSSEGNQKKLWSEAALRHREGSPANGVKGTEEALRDEEKGEFKSYHSSGKTQGARRGETRRRKMNTKSNLLKDEKSS